MVEFIEGSGFYPPTFNSFTGNISFQESVGAETKTFSLTMTDRVELSSLSFFHEQISSLATVGTYQAVLYVGNNLVTQYSYSATSTGNAVYLDTLIQNTSITLNKGDVIKMTISSGDVGGGTGTQKGSITVFGKYVL